MTQLELVEHLSLEEIGRRFRATRELVERAHWQVVWLVGQGRSGGEVARITGLGRTWVGAIVRRYNSDGPESLGDRRHHNPGAKPLLSEADVEELRATLESPPADGGLWTGPKVAAWLEARKGARFGRSGGGKRCAGSARACRCRGRGTPRRPALTSRRPSKNLAARLDALRAEQPGRSVELWAMDEHRLGLKPVLRRQWAPKGQRPIAVGHHRYEWLYLDGFVRPGTGEVTWFLCNGVSTELFEALLVAFAEATGAGAGKLILLLLDNAGWHVSERLQVPEGIELMFLPPYTPELQPAEHLWPLADEAVANKSFATLKELDQALAERCRTLATMPALIHAHTHFDWWPADTKPLALN